MSITRVSDTFRRTTQNREREPLASVGAVVPLAYNGTPAGWLKCNGATVSRSTYASLFSAIGTTYGAGDGSTTFALPDLRGVFIRGVDDGRGLDTGRSMGSYQAHGTASHSHSTPQVVGCNSGYTPNRTRAIAGNTGSTGSETRPKNLSITYIIKF